MEWMYATRSCLDFFFCFFRCRKSRINELPDDIIVSIISFLTIKEAIATSVLSRRWRHMWKYTTGSWRFDLSELCDHNYVKNGTDGHGTGEDYVMRVNQALESHRGPFLYELGFCMDQTYCPLARTSMIDNWISIASRKCVRRLDLNTPGINLNNIVPTLPAFSQLTHLTLKCIKITEETICYFLSSCLLLEHLCVIDVDQLIKLKVGGGSSLKLKHLEISDCFWLKSLEISAPNLVSFACRGLYILYTQSWGYILFKDVPLLSTLSIGPSTLSFGPRALMENLKIIRPSSYVSQIKSLTVELDRLDESCLSQPDLELSNLKHLEMRIDVWFLKSFLPFSSLLKASPLLSSLKIELGMSRCRLPEMREKFVAAVNWRENRKDGKLMHEATIYRHQCLRMVTLTEFVGHPHDTEVALHLIGMATSLEKMVIDCSRVIPFLTPESGRKERSIARKIAEGLRSKLPPVTELVVL